MSRQGWIRGLLILWVCAGAWWLSRLDFSHRVTTDVLGLIPADDRNPELALIRTLASEKQARMVIAALVIKPGGNASTLESAVDWLTREQTANPLFEQVTRVDSSAGFAEVGRYLFEHRLQLGLAQWLENWEARWTSEGQGEGQSRWVAEKSADALDDFLSRPEALVAADLAEKDPLLLLLPAIEVLTQAQGIRRTPSEAKLVWSLQKAPPFSEEGQRPIDDAFVGWARVLNERFPGVELHWTAVSRFALRNRTEIEGDLRWINLLSLAGVAAVAMLGVSRLTRVWHLIPPVLLGTLGAWVVTTIVFPQVHVLVLVVGALLSGVAIDYGFYLFVQPLAVVDESYGAKVRRLRSPLLGSALTTVLGFLLLCVSDLPLLKQLGVFVSAGLLFALAGALLWFGQLRQHHLAVRARVTAPLRLGAVRSWVPWIGTLLVVLAGLGFMRIRWQDDVRMLQVPAEDLRANDRQLRQWMGDESGREVFISSGKNFAEARQAWERFRHAHDLGDSWFSLAGLLPTEDSFRKIPARRDRLATFPEEFTRVLGERGFEPGVAAVAGEEWGSGTLAGIEYEHVMEELAAHLPGPLSLLMGKSAERAWFVTLAPRQSGKLVEGTLGISQLENLNDLFSRYRASALRLGLFGFGVLFGSVLVMYGPKRGVAVFAVPCCAMVLAFGALGWSGTPLNLFHLLGAFLGVCLSHNYAIFTTENSLRGEGFPPSVRLSAVAAAVSFGVLGLSSVPVVRALGLTVALIVVIAWWIAEVIYAFEKATARDFRA